MSVNRYNATTDTMEHIAGNEAIILDEVPTEGSNNAVKSGGVFAELANKANLTQISNPNLLDNPWFTGNNIRFDSRRCICTGQQGRRYPVYRHFSRLIKRRVK